MIAHQYMMGSDSSLQKSPGGLRQESERDASVLAISSTLMKLSVLIVHTISADSGDSANLKLRLPLQNVDGGQDRIHSI